MRLCQKEINILKLLTFYMAILSVFAGCAASIKLVRNENVTVDIKNYRELYFIKPEKDPGNIVPKVIWRFKNIGFKVRVVDLEKPIEGAQGTGFLISDNGYILTCAHVIGKESEATIWHSGIRHEADILTINEDVDLALLRKGYFSRARCC